MDKDTTKVAEKIFKAVKNELASARKYNKEHNYERRTMACGRRREMVDLGVYSNTEWKDGYKNVRSYIIRLEDKDMGELLTHYDIGEVFRKLRRLLDEQKKVRNWGGLSYNTEEVDLDSCSWRGYRTAIVSKVCLADATCKEYTSLINYLNKFLSYGKITNYEFFSSAMGGKRGVLWDEYGERYFLDNKPNKCKRVLAELRKAKGSKDTLTIKRGEENYMDEEERRYSVYAEIECEGEKRKYMEITIKTPTGKVKYQQKIY